MLKLCKINASPNGTLGLHLSRAPWDPYPWVSAVQENSSAYQAGIRIGDTVLELNGADILGQKISELAMRIHSHWNNGGKHVNFLVWRSKNDQNSINQQSLQKFATCLQNIAQLLECPVCLEVVKPPGWQCCNGHVLCNSCRGRTAKCPICRVTLGPRGRCLLSDKLFALLAESFPIKTSTVAESTKTATTVITARIPEQTAPVSETSGEEEEVLHRDKNDLKEQQDKILHKEIYNTTEKDGKVKSFKKGNCTNNRSHTIDELLCDDKMKNFSLNSEKYFPFMSNNNNQRKERSYHCPTGKSCCQDNKNSISKLYSQWDVLTHLRRDHNLSIVQYYEAYGERVNIQFSNKSIHCVSIVTATTGEKETNENRIDTNRNNVERPDAASIVPVKIDKNSYGNGRNLPANLLHNMGKLSSIRRKASSSNTTMNASTANVVSSASDVKKDATMKDSSSQTVEINTNDSMMENDLMPVRMKTSPRTGTLPTLGAPNDAVEFTGISNTIVSSEFTETSPDSEIDLGKVFAMELFFIVKFPIADGNFDSTDISILSATTTTTPTTTINAPITENSTATLAMFNSAAGSVNERSVSTCKNENSILNEKCCTDLTKRKCAIFIWYCGTEEDVKKFQAVIECKNSGIKWTGWIHPMTKSWEVVHCQKEFLQTTIEDGNSCEIVIKLKEKKNV